MAEERNIAWLWWLRCAVLIFLACLTAVYFYDAFSTHGAAALREWRGRWKVVPLCVALNFTGLSLDFFCWVWMYRRCGVQVRGVMSPLIFFSVFAAHVMPAQTGRLVRPDAAWRHGFGSLRNGAEAEAALLLLDLIGTLALVGGLLAWMIMPMSAPLVFAAALAGGLATASIMASLLRRFLGDLRRGLFWSRQGAITAILRAADRALLGLALLVLIHPFAPQMGYPTATVYVLTSDIAGALSGVPGGLGVAEGMLSWFLAMSHIPDAHVALSVTVFRVLSFWGLVPLAWLALLATLIPSAETKEKS